MFSRNRRASEGDNWTEVGGGARASKRGSRWRQEPQILPKLTFSDDRSLILVILGTTVARLGASAHTKGDTVKGRRVGLAAVIRLASLDKHYWIIYSKGVSICSLIHKVCFREAPFWNGSLNALPNTLKKGLPYERGMYEPSISKRNSNIAVVISQSALHYCASPIVSVVINIGSEFGFAKAISFSCSGIMHLAAKLF